MTVRLSPEAAADLTEAFRWYSERDSTLGLEFLAAVDEVLRRVGCFVLYALDRSGPVVIGLFHAHRDPVVWRIRTRPA